MGWATGSEIAEELWNKLQPYLKQGNEKYVSKIIYDIFTEHDADDWGYQLQDKESLFYTYMKLNEPEEFKELMEEMYG